ncbi:MAG: SOS response-associated peptidase [Gemmatimonadota bacterium]
MCGRYTLTLDQEALQVALGIERLLPHRPRYNISPSQEVLVLAGGDSGPRPVLVRWGMQAPRSGPRSSSQLIINARSETVHRKPTFREAFREGRCLVPADGFYEWKASGIGKVPSWIHRRGGEPFTFGAIVRPPTSSAPTSTGDADNAPPPGDSALGDMAILTAPASDLLRPIHDRMPVVIPSSGRALWLDPEACQEDLEVLMVAEYPEDFTIREVSTRVNSPAHDDPACIEAGDSPLQDLPLFGED